MIVSEASSSNRVRTEILSFRLSFFPSFLPFFLSLARTPSQTLLPFDALSFSSPSRGDNRAYVNSLRLERTVYPRVDVAAASSNRDQSARKRNGQRGRQRENERRRKKKKKASYCWWKKQPPKERQRYRLLTQIRSKPFPLSSNPHTPSTTSAVRFVRGVCHSPLTETSKQRKSRRKVIENDNSRRYAVHRARTARSARARQVQPRRTADVLCT